MINVSVLSEFLGWCTLINIGLLCYSTVMIMLFGDFVKKIHGKLFRISESQLEITYFNFLGHYKLAILVFNLVPYCALKIMG